MKESVRTEERTTEIRPIWCETGFLPRTHGSGLFTRGQTQVLTVTTLGTVSDCQTLDGISEETEKRYIHHYKLSSLQRRRSENLQKSGEKRDRTRCSGGKSSAAGHSSGRGISLCHPSRIRGPLF